MRSAIRAHSTTTCTSGNDICSVHLADKRNKLRRIIMAVNHALATIGNGLGATLSPGSGTIDLDIQYGVLDSSDDVVGSIVGLSITLSYDNMAHIRAAIKAAVQANESDPTLRVYVV
jgi:hypothetical protein